ncbi:hypothetical protein KIPB_015835, partial [Kipferlia bialata]|eukprot:g15835.t1
MVGQLPEGTEEGKLSAVCMLNYSMPLFVSFMFEIGLSLMCLPKQWCLRTSVYSLFMCVILVLMSWRSPSISAFYPVFPLILAVFGLYDSVMEHIKVRTSIMCLAEALAAKVLVTRVASGR